MMLKRSLSLSRLPTTNELGEDIPVLKPNKRKVIGIECSREQISFTATGEQVKFQHMVQKLSVYDDNSKKLKSWKLDFEGSCNSINEKIPLLKERTSTESKVIALKKVMPKKKIKKDIGMIRSLTEEQQQYLKQKKSRGDILFITLLLIVVFVAVFAISYMQLASYRRNCEMKLNVQEIKFVLQRTVHGQKCAIDEITTELSAFSNMKEKQITILAFVGGVGVGKSYTASIISANFLWGSNVQEFVMPMYRSLSAEKVSAEFSLCGDNLLVIDDLKVKDIGIIAEFLGELIKHNNMMGTRVGVVLVFTTKNQDSNEIRSSFQATRLPVNMIEFQRIQQDIVEMCIEESLFNKGVNWNKYDVQKVLKLLPEDTGCKGVSSKVHIAMALDSAADQRQQNTH